MERIYYAGGTVLTGSAIARALLDYARALGETEGSDTVRVPSRLDDGSIGSAEFLIGPASQLVSKTESDVGEELVDEALVEHFRREAALLDDPPGVQIDDQPHPSSSIDDLELPLPGE